MPGHPLKLYGRAAVTFVRDEGSRPIAAEGRHVPGRVTCAAVAA